MIIDIDKITANIEYEEADLQCLESCARQGFSIDDWIECKREMISITKSTMQKKER